MEQYYDRRASEYEAVYRRDDPVRQKELGDMEVAVKEAMRGKRVLEIACGTGYWTERVVETAGHVVGIDAAPATLEIAQSKNLPQDKVDFRLGDAYDKKTFSGDFDAGLAMFWFSHVPRQQIPKFLTELHGALKGGSTVFLAENMLQEGIGGELIHKPGMNDTFKRRKLADGSTHDILKNYYTHAELEAILSPFATDLQINMGVCFYRARYITRMNTI